MNRRRITSKWWVSFLMFLAFVPSQAQVPQAIIWHPWPDEIFAQAVKEHKFVLLDLEAVWCHWCHVLDQQTYRDAAVRQLMGKSYIAVKVDTRTTAGQPQLSSKPTVARS
jgi:thiol:disulfide interchange protein